MNKSVLASLVLIAALTGCAASHSTSGSFPGKVDAATHMASARRAALRLVNEHRCDEAEAALKPIFTANPSDSEVQLALGECALGKAKLDEATQIFSAVANDPKLRPKALQGLGIVLARRGDAKAAIAALEQATAADPSQWRAWNALGLAYALVQNWDASQRAYEHATNNAPDRAIIENNIGMVLLAQDRYDDAIKAFDRAYLANPKLMTAQTNRQLALALQQRYDEATFATRPEEKARLLNNAGYIALLKGDYERAEQFFVKATETSPTYYAPAHDNLKLLEQVRAKAHDKHS